jgi:lysozyme family protein
MASFEKAQEFVKGAEGGYSTDKTDKGNYYNGVFVGTNHGISAPVLAEWLGRTPTIQDMKNLSYETALKIYKNNYWNKISGDSISNNSISALLYDAAVNQGTGKAKEIVSKTLNINVSLPFSKAVTDTINNYKNQEELFNKMKQTRISLYNSKDSHYQAWMDRVNKILFEAGKATEIVKKNALPLILAGVLLAGVTLAIIYRNELIKTI